MPPIVRIDTVVIVSDSVARTAFLDKTPSAER